MKKILFILISFSFQMMFCPKEQSLALSDAEQNILIQYFCKKYKAKKQDVVIQKNVKNNGYNFINTKNDGVWFVTLPRLRQIVEDDLPTELTRQGAFMHL